MELGKVLDGFTVADTLVIKAQVQVIHEKIARPFRCLDPQYRRELVRVYLTNVEVRFIVLISEYSSFFFLLRSARTHFLTFYTNKLATIVSQRLSQNKETSSFAVKRSIR